MSLRRFKEVGDNGSGKNKLPEASGVRPAAADDKVVDQALSGCTDIDPRHAAQTLDAAANVAFNGDIDGKNTLFDDQSRILGNNPDGANKMICAFLYLSRIYPNARTERRKELAYSRIFRHRMSCKGARTALCRSDPLLSRLRTKSW